MSGAVFDASVVVKWLILDDRFSPAARTARGQFEAFAPALVQVEVANALWGYVRAGAVPLADAIEGVAVLPGIMSLTEDSLLIEKAQRLSAELDHPVYDCLYLALARDLSMPLITADRKLAKKSGALRLDTHFIGPKV